MEQAYDAGIRHFDVAPMYGLGRSESELARFIGWRRSEITITTKFGIEPSVLGRLAGSLQRPVRSLLNSIPNMQKQVQNSGRGPASGSMGRLLYASVGYSAGVARESLDRSLRALGTDYIDFFMLHEPSGELILDIQGVADYLDDQISRGRIRAWGVASDMVQLDESQRGLSQRCWVLQCRDDIFEDYLEGAESKQARITFGVFERALPLLNDYFQRSPEERRVWSGRLGFDVSDGISLPNLLVRHALHRNKSGPVLFSSTRPERVRAAVSQGDINQDPAAEEEESSALTELAALLKQAYPRQGLKA